MSGFLFGRHQQQSGPKEDTAAAAALERAAAALLEAQSITASAIFALLVSKGVLSAAEAAGYMREIGEVLARDVPAPHGAEAGARLASYGEALSAAGG
jgi:glycyl-tRNA synthetase alpha subunit